MKLKEFLSVDKTKLLVLSLIKAFFAENLSMLFVMPQDTGNFTKLFDDEENTMKNKFHGIISEIWSGKHHNISLL